MHPLVSSLTSLLPPPPLTDPPTTRPPWEEMPATTGFPLPQDYRDFVDVYGGGQIDDHLTVLHPTLEPPFPGYPGGMNGFARYTLERIGGTFAELHDSDPEAYPFPVYPALGGLLPWGLTSDSDHFFWRTGPDSPEDWPVVIWFRHAGPPDWAHFDGGMAAFLLSLVDDSSPYRDALLPPSAGHCWTRTRDWSQDYL